MRRALQRHWPALAVLAALTAYRASLLGSGAFAWPDESYYANAIEAVHALGRGDLRAFAAELIPYARPLAVIAWLLPAAIQSWLGAATGLGPTHPSSALVPTAPNVLVTLAVGVAYYRLALVLLGGGRAAATLALTVYAAMASSNLYVRHVVPYDAGLLLLMAAWRASLTTSGDRRALLHSGLLAAAALSTYPALQPSIAALALFHLVAVQAEGAQGRLARVRRLAWFLLPVAAALLLWSALALWAGTSYVRQFEAIQSIHAHLAQGSFDEGFAFLPKYLFQVEGPLGMALLALIAVYVVAAVRAARAGGRQRALDAVLRCVAVAWFAHGFTSVALRRIFFTGRYVHAYMPFVVLAAVAAIDGARNVRWRHAGYGALAAVALASLVAFDLRYRHLAYPVNLLHRAGLGYRDFAGSLRLSQVTLAPRFTAGVVAGMEVPPAAAPPYEELERPPGTAPAYALLNVGFVPHGFEVLPPPDVPPGAELLASGPHFLSFRACQFEHLPPAQRATIDALHLQMSVYRLGSSR